MTLLQFISRLGKVQEYSRKSQIVLFAYYLRTYSGKVVFSTGEIRNCFRECLLKTPSDLTSLLRALAKGKESPLMKATRAGHYSLSIYGLKEIEAYLGAQPASSEEIDSFLETAIPYLKKVIAKVGDDNQRNFIAEAIACLGVDAKRATIIMTWVGTLRHLHNYVFTKKLKEFNQALKRRSGWLSKIVVKEMDDFSDIKEAVFIELCRSAGIISNDVRKILDEKLGIRNTCSHPSGIEVHSTKVVNFIEDLVDNVIAKYTV